MPSFRKTREVLALALDARFVVVESFTFLPAKNGEVSYVCRDECFHDRDLFLVLLLYTKLVYFTVLILDLSANIQIYLDNRDFY